MRRPAVRMLGRSPSDRSCAQGIWGVRVASFDFVAGDDFRAGLQSDYQEMEQAIKSESWKSVHVLAGSIVEAMLVDYIAGSDLPAKKGIDPLTLDLGGAIKLCRDEGIVSERVASLSDVVRSYRNLIHPGRVIRLEETVDANSASLASTLVEMVASELGKSRVESKGLTAEQLLAKVRNDPTVGSIMAHLVAEMEQSEIERALLAVLPDAYIEELALDFNGDVPLMGRVQETYRKVFDQSSDQGKKQAAERYVEVLRNEGQVSVAAWETAFFHAAMLDHLPSTDRTMVKTHLIARIKEDRTADLFQAAHGLGARITSKEQTELISAAVSEIAYGQSDVDDKAAREMLGDMYRTESEEADKRLFRRLKIWVDFLNERGRTEEAKAVDALRAQYEDLADLPF
jgi:hypothetical protein